MIFVKHIRNKVKSKYNKGEECYICKSADTLEFHHLLCLSTETRKILRKSGYRDYPRDDDPNFHQLIEIVATNPDIVNPQYFYTLCQICHKALHKRFGQNYTAWKPVQIYLAKEKERHGNT